MTNIRQTQVAIIGAGPAGMAAARSLCRAGAQVTVVDANQKAGGQIYRQPANPRVTKTGHATGDQLLRDLAQPSLPSSLQWCLGSQVWEITADRIYLQNEEQSQVLQAERIILATGAQDRSLAFPGWTLPGVITAGAAQVMVRGQQLQPGKRAVVAGTGPLLLPTAAALLQAGVKVLALLEANPIGSQGRALWTSLKDPYLRKEAWRYLRLLAQHGLRPRMGHAVFAAHGQGELQHVVAGRLNRRGDPIAGSEYEFTADLCCVGYGLTPVLDLPLRLGCATQYCEERGGWAVSHDELMQSKVPGVYVAGEVAGIGGVQVALAEGHLAGLAVARSLGLSQSSDQDSELRAAQQERKRYRRLSDRLLRAFPVLPGLHNLATAQTLVCRCEDVTLAQVQGALRTHGADLRGIKMATRAGMGPCQGRVCHSLLAGLLQHRFGMPGPMPPPSVQMPLQPVSTRTLLQAQEESC